LAEYTLKFVIICISFKFVCFIADDFEDEPLKVYFRSTDTSKQVFLKTKEDDVFEPNENFSIFLQVLDEYQQLGVEIDLNKKAIITIINDDGKIYHMFQCLK